MTREEQREKEHTKNYFDNFNPCSPALYSLNWQTLMTAWFNAYGEFFRNATKMTENWYETYWKPWFNWQQEQNLRVRDQVKVE